MKLHDLKPAPGSKRPKRRVGRGIGGKGGKTAGRGSKGQGARGTVSPRFEGGQTPLHRRTPKSKGFINPFRVEYHVVNLDTLEAFDAGSEVTPETLRDHGLVAKRGLVKVLGRGDLTKSLTVRAHGFSAAAVSAIEAAGGTTHGPAGSVGRPAPAGPRERAHEPLGTLARPRRQRQEVVGPMSGLSRLYNMFRVADLRNKILFTIFIIFIFRIGSYIPVPYVDFHAILAAEEGFQNGHAAAVGFLDLFSGGALTGAAVFALGIMPYITSSIIMQLLGVVIPKLEEWQNEGQTGQKKITQWTRYLTVALALMQSTALVFVLKSGKGGLLCQSYTELPAGTVLIHPSPRSRPD